MTGSARGPGEPALGHGELLEVGADLRLPLAARRIAAFLEGHPGWSAFWDKHDGVWRVAEDDPSSELYAESADADSVINYMAAHARREVRHDHGE